MAGTQMIKVALQRDSLHTPWGFRLQGGADFALPFTINKVAAGSPADGILHRGDVILEIDERPISAMHHLDALELVQRAGGQITFFIQRGSSPLPSYTNNSRPFSAMPWSIANATSYLDKTFGQSWRQPAAAPLNSAGLYRSRALERIPDPKPVLSQTGSPLMPGPVPSVSTKTRGYIQPPVFRTPGTHFLSLSPVNGSHSPAHSNDHSVSGGTSYQPAWHDSLQHQTNIYVPSYQKKVIESPANQKRTPRPHQHFTTIQRQPEHYRPSSVQPIGLVHRQYNSPMGLYSNQNIQDAMKNQVSHVTRVSIVPSMPKAVVANYKVAVIPSNNTYAASSTPICYVQPKQQSFGSDF